MKEFTVSQKKKIAVTLASAGFKVSVLNKKNKAVIREIEKAINERKN